MKKLILFIILFFPLVSYAECENKELVTKLMETYHPDHPDRPGYRGAVGSEACKIWPADESKTIVALALFKERGDSIPPYDLDVFLVDTKSGEVIGRNWEVDVEGELMHLWDLKIDTARYQLNPQSRAFGVRFNFGSKNTSMQTINLYVMQKGKLNKVLDKLEMSFLGNIDSSGSPCDYTVKRSNTTISINKTSTNGYADLIISEYNEEKGQCEGEENCANEFCDETLINDYDDGDILSYDGKEYRSGMQ